MNRFALPIVGFIICALLAWLALGPRYKNVGNENSGNTPENGIEAITKVKESESFNKKEDEGIAPLREAIEVTQTGSNLSPFLNSSFFGQVIAQNDKPLGGIKVEMLVNQKWQKRWAPLSTSLLSRWEVYTDLEGLFSFPPATYSQADYFLRIDTNEYALLQIENLTANIGRSRDLGKLTLNSGATVSGQVINTMGQPVTNANLKVYLYINEESPRNNSPLTQYTGQLIAQEKNITSDEKGLFEISHLPQRNIFITAEAEDHLVNNSDIINLENLKDIKDIEISVEPALQAQGLILNEKNSPVSGAKIIVKERGYRDWAETESESGKDGKFDFKVSKDSGSFEITVKHPEHIPFREVVGAKRDTGSLLEIKLSNAPTISGRVIDEEKKPVQNATVVLIDSKVDWRTIGGIDTLNQNASAITNEEGFFNISPQLDIEGNTRLTLAGFSESHAITRSQTITFFESNKKPFSLNEDVVIQLQPGLTVKGNIKDYRQDSVEDAQIIIRRLGRKSGPGVAHWASKGTILGQAISDNRGDYEFKNLRSGTYRVEIYHNQFSPHQSEDFYLDDNEYIFNCTLNAPGGIEGKIVGNTSSFNNLVIQASSPGRDLIQTRPYNEQGDFRFQSLMPGKWSLALHNSLIPEQGRSWWQPAQEPLAQTADIQVESGSMAPAQLTINNAEFSTILGQVRINGMPASNHTIFVTPHIFGAPGNDPRMIARQNIKYMKQARTNPDGKFQISGLRSNDYFVIADVPQAKTWDLANTKPTGLSVQEISLETAQEIKIDFDLYTGTLILNHPNQRGRAHTLVRLQPIPDDGRKSHQKTCLSYRSETKITDIPSGNYRVKLSGQKDHYDIFIPEGREAEINITLPKRKPQKKSK